MFFNDIYHNKRVFLTGHTGFKGSWLTVWLERLGASVCGFSDAQQSEPNHFALLNPEILAHRGDIRDYERLRNVLRKFQPEIVFHMAAQPLVRRSYREPCETFSTNVLGTANVLQAARETESVRAVVVITTDKVYENREWSRGYRETDMLGGHDPYAASKACAEIVANSFRDSFYQSEGKLLATARAGNVIGGGDWAEDRLIPDLMKASAKGETTFLRMPGAVRPWEHVLEPLSGYLLLGQKLLEGEQGAAEAWNFGPDAQGCLSVGEITEMVSQYWEKVRIETAPHSKLHETTLLQLDCTKAQTRLNWRSVWNIEETVRETVLWYKTFYESGELITDEQLDQYCDAARTRGITWARRKESPQRIRKAA